EDLAVVQVEVHSCQESPVHATRLEHDWTFDRNWDVGAVGGIHVTADHQLRELLSVEPRGRAGGDDLPAAQDGHPIGDAEHLVETVRDVEDARPPTADTLDDLEQPLDIVWRQHRGRLV